MIAEIRSIIVGFTWGYEIDTKKEFPFLEGEVAKQTNYMDEIAVIGNMRQRGIAKVLGLEYLKICRRQGIKDSTLRTDERNSASMALFYNLGFRSIINYSSRQAIYDPEYLNRIYLRMEIKWKL